MRRRMVTALVAVLSLQVFATLEPARAEVAAAEGVQAAPAPVVGGTHPFLAAFGSLERSMIFGGLLLDPGIVAGVGVDLRYDGNVPDDGDSFEGAIAFHLEYMIYNAAPFAMGPEVTYSAQVNPDPFKTHVVIPAWSLWYTPWKAPIAIGAAAGAKLTFPDGGDPIVETIMFPLRLCWVIPA